MNYRVIAVGEAAAPSWVKEHAPTLPPRPERFTVYLLTAPPRKNLPALVHDPEKAPHKPAFYYDPASLSLCQIQLAYARYRLNRLRIHRLRSRALQKAQLHYVLLDDQGKLLDFNLSSIISAQRYLGITLRKGLSYRIIVPSDNLPTFENDFEMALHGHGIHSTYYIGGSERVLEVVLRPLRLRGKRFVACLALDITLPHQLVERFSAHRELSELVANSLSEGILTIREGATITFANLLAESILGPDITNPSLLAQFLTRPQGYLVLRGRLIHWETRALPVGNFHLVLIKDVTLFYKSEQENQVLRQAWDIGPTGIAILREHPEGLSVLYANPRMQKWFAIHAESIWTQVEKHLSKDMRRSFRQVLSAGDEGEFQLVGSYSRQGWSHLRLYLYPLSLPPREVFPLGSSPSIWAGRVWIAIVQDETILHQLTRRRLLSEARQTQRILQAQEQERQRLAEALHDQVGALLSVTRMSLTTLLSEAPIPLQEKLQAVLHHMDEVIRAVRLTSHLLMPPLVEHFGFRSIAEGLVRRFDQVSPEMNFHLSVSGDEPPLTIQQKLALYRILQELLTNALKHSGATEVIVSLRFKARSLSMEVRDNGHGYDPRILHQSNGGIGLQNIEARLKLLKAAYINRSEPGKGAYVLVEMPLRRRPSLRAKQ